MAGPLMAIPAVIGEMGAGLGAATGIELGGLGSSLFGLGAGTGAGSIIDAAAAAPATGATVGASTSTAPAAVSLSPEAKLLTGVDAGLRLGDLVGLNQDQQPYSPQLPQVQAPPPPQARMPSTNQFSPSALVMLQAMLNKQRQGGAV